MEQNHQKNSELVMDWWEVIRTLCYRVPIIALSGILLSLLAVVGTKLFITPQFQSTTRMYVLAKQNNDTLTNSDLQTSALLTNDYVELIQSRTVTEAVISQLNLNLTHEELLKKLEVSVPADTRILAISVTDSDPYMARFLADTIRDTAAEHIQQVMDVEAVNVADMANIPEQPVSPSIVKNGLIAGVLGCVLAIIVVVVQYLANDTIKTSEDVERFLELSTLGVIPLDVTERKKTKRGNRKAGKIGDR